MLHTVASGRSRDCPPPASGPAAAAPKPPPPPPPPTAGAKQAEEILGKDALEVAALYDQLSVIRFLHERMPEAAEAGTRAARCSTRALSCRRRCDACHAAVLLARPYFPAHAVSSPCALGLKLHGCSQARAGHSEGARRGLWPRHSHRRHALRVHAAGQRQPPGGAGGLSAAAVQPRWPLVCCRLSSSCSNAARTLSDPVSCCLPAAAVHGAEYRQPGEGAGHACRHRGGG